MIQYALSHMLSNFNVLEVKLYDGSHIIYNKYLRTIVLNFLRLPNLQTEALLAPAVKYI